MLLLTETTLNVQSFIGLVMLAGIVVNNAIVLVDYMNQLRRHGGGSLAIRAKTPATPTARPSTAENA